ncbi:class I adenylate cyclase [Oceanicoccus sagamiensis]|uniref:Adenylate cyclase n=1 Tax=Oceanicoccus sagamiensis TaxID=716816 RepID=A0A1X9N7V3_9GAMM|nr:class I adenylate cyclase [Oceanicoccus sagamiensis]ARN74148.1 adenylate cyclase [Oceanicoccus sagamiensis]
MSSLEITHSSIDQGVDRKTLKTIKQRFLQVNNARLARTKSALGARQQIFLELLPMMFHVNHPMLPGYVSHQTPAGLAGYNPSKRDVQKTQRLCRSFTYRRQPTMKRQINGIFLMGSCGTVAQSESSDLDIWLCHPPINDEETMLLRQKCDDISRWAMTIGLEAHFFLMEDEKFRLGERESLSTEDCGSSQHYLLLDEFYRTGLLIAGRIPIWWLIPPEEEQHYDHYANTLRKKRFVRQDETLDFGGVGHIPAGEFVGAGVWQLYKAIDSPYKSVLKILLTEVYAAEYPDVEPLSTSFKRAIYNDQLDIDELDPYVVVYRKLEHYLLERNELKRLELVRRCFYFKVGKPLSRPSRTSSKSWQRQLMEKLVAQWRWPKEQLFNLDARNQWKVARVMAEQKQLVRELTNSYRFVLEFARRTRASAMINSQEMTVLGRKLYAAFERKAGKIEWINPGIAKSLVEDTLTFYQTTTVEYGEEKTAWALSAEEMIPRDIVRDKPIKRADDLTTLLAWCHFNSLLDHSTRVNIIEGEHGVTEYELHSMIRSLRQKLPVAKQYDDEGEEKHDRFGQAMRPTQIKLFINVGVDPLGHFRTQGIERLSSQTDSLGYSALRENLVLNVEQILVNSWGEVSTRRYDGDLALIRCLKDYLLMLPPGNNGTLPKLDIRCFCPTRSNAITMRVEELFRDIAACYYSGTRPANTRYILEIQKEYYVLQFIDNRPVIERVGGYANLLSHLGKLQAQYSPIVLDRYCLNHSVLEAIIQQAQPEQIQVFYQQRDTVADIYVMDERGSLHCFTAPFRDEHSLLSPLDQFIQSTLFRRSSESQGTGNDGFNFANFDLSHFELEYYQIIEAANAVQLTRRHLVNEISGGNFFNVQAIGDKDFNGRLLFNIYCDQQEFTELELGKDLFNTAARFILGRRNSHERYPCYITDLDLSRCGDEASGKNHQTVYFLQHKRRLERELNSALQNL